MLVLGGVFVLTPSTLVEVELLSKTLLHCVTPNSNTQTGIISVDNQH